MGTYTTIGTDEHGSTAYEENTYAAGSASFTEILFESFSSTETGDGFGGYEFSVTDGIRTSSLDATTLDGTDTYTVTQTVTGTFTRDNTGNYLDGSHDNFEDAEDDYEVVQTGTGTKNYTLTITGTNAYTDEEVGAGFTGDYTRTKTGADDYTMVETGTKIGGSYSQTITGEDDYTLEDIGDNGTGHYTRTITGGGTYDRTTSGAGATLPTDTSTIGYGWDQTGDPHSGVFDLTPTGSTRYDLLEDFFDISNTTAAQATGHMNIYSFGQTFVDPLWDEIKMIGGFVGENPLQAVGQWYGGVGQGYTMVGNAGLNIVTGGNSPLQGHVDNMIRENGTGYAVANASITVGVVLLSRRGGVPVVPQGPAAPPRPNEPPLPGFQWELVRNNIGGWCWQARRIQGP